MSKVAKCDLTGRYYLNEWVNDVYKVGLKNNVYGLYGSQDGVLSPCRALLQDHTRLRTYNEVSTMDYRPLQILATHYQSPNGCRRDSILSQIIEKKERTTAGTSHKRMNVDKIKGKWIKSKEYDRAKKREERGSEGTWRVK